MRLRVYVVDAATGRERATLAEHVVFSANEAPRYGPDAGCICQERHGQQQLAELPAEAEPAEDEGGQAG